MKIQVKKQDLIIAINRVQGATSERSLAHIGIRTKQNQIELMAHDRMMAIYCVVPATIEQEGFVFVNNRLFADVVRELPEGDFFIELEQSFIKLHGNTNAHFELKIPILSDLAWQELPQDFDNTNFFSLDAQKCHYMVEQVQFCISIDSPRNYGTVGYLHKPDKDHLRLVGTDGYRLSYCDTQMSLPAGFLEAEGVCLSKRALQEFARMCQEGFEKIEVAINKENGTMMLRLPDYKVFIRLSAVKFPNYFGVLPKGELHKVLLSSPVLQSVSKRILLTSDKNKTMQLSFSDKSLTLSSKTTGSSEGREQIDLDNKVEQDAVITINGKFLSEVFNTTSSSHLELLYKNNPSDPIVIYPKEEPAGCISKHVLVPIREVHPN